MANDVKLGVLLKGDEPRDAIHVAIAPVVAAHILLPGEHVGFVGDDESEPYRVGRISPKLGIVDPFLTEPVMPGQRCWLFLYTQTITSLRHDWTHPAFGKLSVASEQVEDEKAKSERWLRVFAEEVGVSYRVLMDAAANYLGSRTGDRWSGEYHILNYDTPDVVYEKREEMWKHYEIVTGTKIEDKEATFFSCSC